MASLAQLSASIAHEINQPLAAIAASGNAALRWLAATPPNLERAHEAVDSVVRDATRGGEIVRRIRSLAGGAAMPTEALDLNDVVLEVVGLTQGELRTGRISLRPILSGTLPPIAGHRVQLQQVMINLIRQCRRRDRCEPGQRPRNCGLHDAADAWYRATDGPR